MTHPYRDNRRSSVKLIAALSLVALTLSTGCFKMPQNLQSMVSGHYEELQRQVDVNTCKTTQVKTSTLFPICFAHSKLKRYDKLFQCLDCLEDNIKKGDRIYLDVDEMARDNPVLSGFEDTRVRKERAAILYDIGGFTSLLRAEAFIELGDYPGAIAESRKAYKNIPRGGALETYFEINALSSLGVAYALNGDKGDSRETLRRLEAVRTFVGGALTQKTEKAIGIAKIFMALGDYNNALATLQSVDDAAFFRRVTDVMFGVSLQGDSMWTYQQLPKKFMLDKCLLETGRVQEAKTGFDELLKTPQTRDNGEIFWMILFERGRIAEKEGDLKGAIDFYRQAVDVIETQRMTINTEANKIGFVGDKQRVYYQMIAALYSDRQYDRAFEYVERSKSRALVDILSTKQDFAARTTNEKEVLGLISENKNLETEARGEDLSPDKSRTRGVIIRNKELMRDKAPELFSLVNVSVLTAGDIASLVPRDEALVEYYYREGDLYVFVLSGGGLKAFRTDGAGLSEDILEFRKALHMPASSQYRELSEKLYRRLFQPIESALDKHDLIIVPHGALHYLPMNALYDGSRYLVDRYTIRIMPSSSAIRYLHERKPDKPGAILVFGNPDLGDLQYDLAFAQQEAVSVAGTRPDSRVFLRKEATEGAFRRFGNGYSYIHFATHGQFNPEAPLKSALLLAPDSQYDGFLTADKLYSMQLDADLVTLSACETGLSKVAQGDELIGLVRGFLYAGSSSIVTSLWEVDDRATAYLMTLFYEGMNKTDKREALRTAQLETRKKYPHPYYWASFQFIGSVR